MVGRQPEVVSVAESQELLSRYHNTTIMIEINQTSFANFEHARITELLIDCSDISCR